MPSLPSYTFPKVKVNAGPCVISEGWDPFSQRRETNQGEKEETIHLFLIPPWRLCSGGLRDPLPEVRSWAPLKPPRLNFNGPFVLRHLFQIQVLGGSM